MKRSNGMIITLTALFLASSVTLANSDIDTKALDQHTSVLPDGARIVAGDPAKNEFFILGKNDVRNDATPPTAVPKVIPNDATETPKLIIAKNKQVPNVKVAALKSHSVAKPKLIAAKHAQKSKLVAEKKLHHGSVKLASNKTLTIAMNHEPQKKFAKKPVAKHAIAIKKNISKIDLALNEAQKVKAKDADG